MSQSVAKGRGDHIPCEGKERTSHCVTQSNPTRLDLLWKERMERRYCESIRCERERASHTLQGEGTDGHEML